MYKKRWKKKFSEKKEKLNRLIVNQSTQCANCVRMWPMKFTEIITIK